MLKGLKVHSTDSWRRNASKVQNKVIANFFSIDLKEEKNIVLQRFKVSQKG